MSSPTLPPIQLPSSLNAHSIPPLSSSELSFIPTDQIEPPSTPTIRGVSPPPSPSSSDDTHYNNSENNGFSADELMEDESEDSEAEGRDNEDRVDNSATALPRYDVIHRAFERFSRRGGRYGITEFIKEYCQPSRTRRRSGKRNGHHIGRLIRALRDPVVRAELATSGVTLRFPEEEAIPTPENIRKELRALSKTRSFGEFTPSQFARDTSEDGHTSVKEVCDITWIDERLKGAWPTLQQTAPILTTLLQAVMLPSRHEQASYSRGRKLAPETINHPKITMISSIMMSAVYPRSRDFLPQLLGFYVRTSGVPVRVHHTLSRFGVVSSYRTVLRTMDRIAKHSKDNLKRVLRDPGLVIVYDNFNFMDRVSGAGLGRKDVMVNLTNCLLVSSDDVVGPFRPDQFRPSVPFDRRWVNEYLLKPPTLLPRATSFLSGESLRSILQLSETDAARYSTCLPAFPNIARPRSKASYILQTPAIPENEGEIAGVYRLHDRLFFDILGLDQGEEAFNDRLFLIHGDQKTTSYIRHIQSSQLEARTAYHRKQWMISVPAFFHIQMNLTDLIFKQFWELVLVDAQGLGRGQKIQPSGTDFYLKLHLLRDAFQVRLFTLIVGILHARRRILTEQLNPVDLKRAILAIPPEEIADITEEITEYIFSPKTLRGHRPVWQRVPASLLPTTNECRYLYTILHLLVITRAIHEGDYGVLRNMIPALPALFYGGGASHYGPEMLYFAWLLRPEVTDRTLSDGILRSGLVRCVTAGSGWKPIDLALEHVNGAFAIDIKNNKNSTHDTPRIFEAMSVLGPYTASIRRTVESLWGKHNSGAHTTPSTARDQLDYTCIRIINHIENRIRDFGGWIAPDLISTGMQALNLTKLDTFNSKEIRPADHGLMDDLPDLVDEGGVEEAIREGLRLFGDDEIEDESDEG